MGVIFYMDKLILNLIVKNFWNEISWGSGRIYLGNNKKFDIKKIQGASNCAYKN